MSIHGQQTACATRVNMAQDEELPHSAGIHEDVSQFKLCIMMNLIELSRFLGRKHLNGRSLKSTPGQTGMR